MFFSSRGDENWPNEFPLFKGKFIGSQVPWASFKSSGRGGSVIEGSALCIMTRSCMLEIDATKE